MQSIKSVLVVEDDEAIRLAMARILDLTGEYEVILAEDGNEALKKMENFVPDMVISDISMPVMDGIELCRRIRGNELTRTLPFVYLTAKKELLVEGMKAGGDDFINKPFKVDEVLAKIEAIFRRVENSRQQANEIKGNLSEYAFEDILELCHRESISGELTLQKSGEVGIIKLERGDITNIKYKSLADDEALDILRGWGTGIFVIRTGGMKLKSGFKLYKPDEHDLTEPVQIARNTWWIGYRNPDTLLQMNVYLRQFPSGDKKINYLIDTGAPVDFSVISEKISKLIGSISHIHLYSLNNPDPDVCMNSMFIRKANRKAICLTTEDNWRLISHYEINPQSVKLTNTFKDWKMSLTTGHDIQFIPAPFAQGKGAFLIYDLNSRVLFTGDLFGGISDAGRINTLYAVEEDWEGIRAFHQFYMPGRRAISHILDEIKMLNPAPLMIAPQHGNIIRGSLLNEFLERLYYLDVGVDLIGKESKSPIAELCIEASNELIEEALSFMTKERIISKLNSNAKLISICSFRDGMIEKIHNSPDLVFGELSMSLIENEPVTTMNHLKSLALKIAFAKGLQAPSLDWEGTETTLKKLPDHFFD